MTESERTLAESVAALQSGIDIQYAFASIGTLKTEDDVSSATFPDTEPGSKKPDGHAKHD